MEATLTKPKQSYVFDHKLTPEEIQELVDNYDYDPKYLDPDYEDPDDDGILFDRFGNPTEATIRSWYEVQHGYLDGPYTLEEYDAMLDELRAEVEAEMNNEANKTKCAVPA